MSTDLRKVRGLGAAGSGTGHYIHQRVTAIALLFLVPWFVYSIIHAGKAGYEGALTWVAQPVNAILLILTLGAALYHMRLGLQVVIEDYIHRTASKQALLILNTFVVIALAATTMLSVLKIWFSAGA
ncbi:MAG: succinate dehydrogenase, hydrophobic membrane anchor protein [Henriciella sp.]|nr:succinate dehydrogenase, hydrophobic membrane anchor protein [Henriciella sp.]